MTKQEYERLYRSSQTTLDRLTVQTMRRLRGTYLNAARDVAEQVRQATMAGRAQLTIDSLMAIESQLVASAQTIADALQGETPELIQRAYKKLYTIDYQYVSTALTAAAVKRVSAGQLQGLGQAINHRLMESLVNRVWQDGYTFSDRTVLAGKTFQRNIKNLLSGGLAQGRDPIQIAKDITQYVQKGKGILEGRWGKLEPGTRQYYRRIPRNIDYRALRIVRSELYQSIQDAGKLQGSMNPAATGMYNWILEPGERPSDDPCPDIAANGPYKLENVPAYPHPNCRCHVSPVLMNRNEFVADLKRWSNGEAVGYLDEWEQKLDSGILTV